MSALAVSSSAFAVGVVGILCGVFLLLLASSFARVRKSAHQPSPTAGAKGERRLKGEPELPISRRDFFRGGLIASLAVFGAQFGGATLAMLWPNLKGGFGSLITVPDTADAIKSQIASNRQPYYFGAGRFYVINYAALGGTGDRGGGPYEGISAEGLMAIYQKCAHLGCRVPFCQSSAWFECPCHGSKYNHAGEYELGPAPTGLHRFKLTVDESIVHVDTSTVIIGPPRGTDTIHQAPEGPFCV
jgi:cytochrome b6-f complex iron-sulfur subunit